MGVSQRNVYMPNITIHIAIVYVKQRANETELVNSASHCSFNHDLMDDSPKTFSQKLQHHRGEIIDSINPSELYPCLVQGKLLSLKDIQTIRDSQPSKRKEAEAILCLVEKKGERSHKTYARFLRSLKSARQHLGHVYVTSLLEGTDFAPRTELNASASIKSRLSLIEPIVHAPHWGSD